MDDIAPTIPGRHDALLPDLVPPFHQAHIRVARVSTSDTVLDVVARAGH